MTKAEYPRVLRFDLSTVTRNIAGPSNPHARVSTADLKEKGIAGVVENRDDGLMPDGAIIIAAITSCTNTSNPRNTVAAGLLARKANELGLVRKPWVKSSFAPGSKAAALYLEEAGVLKDLEKLGFGIVAYACTTCNGMSGALDPAIQQEIIDRDLYATAVFLVTVTSMAVSILMQNKRSWHLRRLLWHMQLQVRSVLTSKKMR